MRMMYKPNMPMTMSKLETLLSRANLFLSYHGMRNETSKFLQQYDKMHRFILMLHLLE